MNTLTHPWTIFALSPIGLLFIGCGGEVDKSHAYSPSSYTFVIVFNKQPKKLEYCALAEIFLQNKWDISVSQIQVVLLECMTASIWSKFIHNITRKKTACLYGPVWPVAWFVISCNYIYFKDLNHLNFRDFGLYHSRRYKIAARDFTHECHIYLAAFFLLFLNTRACLVWMVILNI